MKLHLVSINVSKPANIHYKGKVIGTAIGKRPVLPPVRLSFTQLDGDGQANQVHHGGPDKAVCAYFHEHYPYWENILEQPLAPGAFGENFTLHGATEADIAIGDTFRLGEVRLQVSQPRIPCYKLSAKFGRPSLETEVRASGYTGFYFRVLTPGIVMPNETLTLETRHPDQITIQEANRIMHRDTKDMEGLRKLLSVGALAESWRSILTKRWPPNGGTSSN